MQALNFLHPSELAFACIKYIIYLNLTDALILTRNQKVDQFDTTDVNHIGWHLRVEESGNIEISYWVLLAQCAKITKRTSQMLWVLLANLASLSIKIFVARSLSRRSQVEALINIQEAGLPVVRAFFPLSVE